MLVKIKANIPEILLGVFLTVAVFSAGYLISPSFHHQPSNQNTTGATDKSGSDVTANNSENKLTDWLLVCFSGLLFGSNLLLWNVTKKSADVAGDALTKLERAFVAMSPEVKGIFDPRLNRIVAYRCSILLKNTGHTPTKHLFSHVAWAGFIGDIPGDFTYPDRGMADEPQPNEPSFIAAGDIVRSPPMVIPVEFIEAARQGHIKIYIWGWAEYDDIFVGTKPHRTEFCNEIIATGDPYVPAQELPLGFRIAFPHVGADETCFRKARPHALRRTNYI